VNAWVRITQCDVPGMLAGAVEVEVRSDHGTGATYYAGSEEEYGFTVVRPVDSRGEARGPEWAVDGGILDAIELIQAGAGCRECDETGVTEEALGDPADAREVECSECDGLGWVDV
jgi:hypothetical protein